jgi:Domain of unknown function (DUF4192)
MAAGYAGSVSPMVFPAYGLVGFGGREPVAEGDGEGVERGFPSHRPAGAAVELHEILGVEDGRYWSYLCSDPSCCPADGVVFDTATHPAAAALATTQPPPLASRDALTAVVAPLAGAPAAAMAAETRQAERSAARLTARSGHSTLTAAGLSAVRAAIEVYRAGGSITRFDRHAWLALVLTSVRVRDDAWARMDPQHHDAHRRLWIDAVRRATSSKPAPGACRLARARAAQQS